MLVNRTVKLVLLLLAAALVLAVVGLVVRVLRWLLYLAIVLVVVAAAVRWARGRAR